MKTLIKNLVLSNAVVLACSGVASASELSLTGQIRVTAAGNLQQIQVDLRNNGDTRAFGPEVSVDISNVGFFGGVKLYPYYGGNTSVANTVFPGFMGYIPIKSFQGTIVPGQQFTVTVMPNGASDFETVSGTVTACKKGSQGCE